MQLRDAVEKYLTIAGSYGKPMALQAFGLSREETERFFSALDEDYHISRFVSFSNTAGESYKINDFPYTHVFIDAGIQSIL
jgi:hypothetical protein